MKNIVLIDFSLQGHHLSFIRTFSKILLEQGHKVICIVPEPEKVQAWLAEKTCEKVKNFSGYPYNYQSLAINNWGRFNSTIKVLHRWKYEGQLIGKIEKEAGIKVDLVFYAWLDNQVAQYVHPFILDRIFPYKWSGLYFHPYHLRLNDTYLKQKAVWRDIDSVFLSRNCVGITVHDTGIVDKFTRRIGKPVLHFPETADDSSPDFSNSTAKVIEEQSRGRLVVGMIGCEKHKGLLTLMRAVRLCDPDKYFFAFLGLLPQVTFSDEEWSEVQSFINNRPENCYFQFDSIPEGADYNAVFCSLDIPFLVYDNFISSSNRLTKAAIFQKLVLASDNYCVGEDVQKFNLGEGVAPKNPQAVANGLEKLSNRIALNDFPYKEWQSYKDLNSVEKLFDRFHEIIALLNKK